MMGGMNPVDKLTTQQRRILVLIAEGMSNAEIGAKLYITTNTVNTHVCRIYRVFGTHSRAHIAALSVALGLSDPTVPSLGQERTQGSPVVVSDHLVQRAVAVAVAGVLQSQGRSVEVSDYRVQKMIMSAVGRSLDQIVDDRRGQVS